MSKLKQILQENTTIILLVSGAFGFGSLHTQLQNRFDGFDKTLHSFEQKLETFDSSVKNLDGTIKQLQMLLDSETQQRDRALIRAFVNVRKADAGIV